MAVRIYTPDYVTGREARLLCRRRVGVSMYMAESLWDFFTPFSLYLQNFGRPTRKPPEFFFVQSALMDLADTTTCPVSHTPWPRPTADFGHHHYY